MNRALSLYEDQVATQKWATMHNAARGDQVYNTNLETRLKARDAWQGTNNAEADYNKHKLS